MIRRATTRHKSQEVGSKVSHRTIKLKTPHPRLNTLTRAIAPVGLLVGRYKDPRPGFPPCLADTSSACTCHTADRPLFAPQRNLIVARVRLSVAALSYNGDLAVTINADGRLRHTDTFASGLGDELDHLSG